jgi:serine protease Do
MNGFGTSKRSLTRVAWVVAVLLPVAAIIVASMWLGKPSQAASSASAAEDIARLESFETGFSAVASSLGPSVVFIEVEQKVSAADTSAAGGDDEDNPWKQFFGPDAPQLPFQAPQRPQRPQRPPVGQGSGVIIDGTGYILTNNHVVRDAQTVTVHLENGQSFPAQVVGTDPMTDLAVVKIDPRRTLPAARLGDAEKAKVGQWAIAVGYPFGASKAGGVFDEPSHYEASITVGVVSALNRQTTSDREGYPFRDLIQTDAPINPGNSGGPLVNIRGEVIGINQQIYTNSAAGGNIGVGFAIPINTRTKAIIETLKGGQKVVRGRLGLTVAPLSDTLKKVYSVDAGVFVQSVEKDGPADRAGIKKGDFVVGYQGQAVDAQDEFVNMVQGTKPGTKVKVEVLRDGKRETVTATVEAIAGAAQAPRAEAAAPEKMGLTVDELPEDVAQKANTKGVRVRAVAPMSDAARAGVMPNDIITKINRTPVSDVASYRKAVEGLHKGDAVAIWIWRAGQDQTLEVDSLSE